MADTKTPRGDANVLTKYLPQLQKAANDTGIPIWLLGAIIMHESGGVAGKVQPDGLGRGLMQVDGGYHSEAFDPRMTGTSPSDVQFQISTGAAILASDIKSAGGDMATGIQAYAGSNYRGPNGVSFAQELQDGYVAPVTRALAFYAIQHGNFSLGNSLKNIPIIGGVLGVTGDIVTGNAPSIPNPADIFKPIVNFVGNKDNWLAIAIGVGGFFLVLGGLFLAFSHSESGQAATSAATKVALA